MLNFSNGFVTLNKKGIKLDTLLNLIYVVDSHNKTNSKIWISDDEYTNKDNYSNSAFDCCFDGELNEAVNYINTVDNSLADRNVVLIDYTSNYILIYVTDRDATKFDFPLVTV